METTYLLRHGDLEAEVCLNSSDDTEELVTIVEGEGLIILHTLGMILVKWELVLGNVDSHP